MGARPNFFSATPPPPAVSRETPFSNLRLGTGSGVFDSPWPGRVLLPALKTVHDFPRSGLLPPGGVDPIRNGHTRSVPLAKSEGASLGAYCLLTLQARIVLHHWLLVIPKVDFLAPLWARLHAPVGF